MQKHNSHYDNKQNSHPPGRVKLASAMRELLKTKDFNSITTSELSKTSGVNEALIYRYFGDKRGLLHALLAEYTEDFLIKIVHDLKGIEGPLNKLRKLIWSSLYFYDKDRIFAKILLLEVRNSPDYFKSNTYNLVKDYAGIIRELIEEGVENGEIRNDIKPVHIRQIVLGSMEHLILPKIIYEKEIQTDDIYQDLCNVVFAGIVPR
jgi:TetR/AcrR family transcriptional regulator, fatty acid metabolism regulator protein